jgi:uncharacterized membrane protein
MTIPTPIARWAIVIAFVVFGLQHLIYGDFVTRVIAKAATSGHVNTPGAYLAGLLLIVCGIGLVTEKNGRYAGLVLSSVILLGFLLIYIPILWKAPILGGLWTNAGKALALSGSALLVAESWPRQQRLGLVNTLEKLIPIAPYLVGSFLVLGGVQHFLFTKFVATLVPHWIPGPVFWTYFAGVALIAGGLGIMLPWTARLAGALTGWMILTWVILLHIPRAITSPRDANETTAVFEALAICAAAFLIANRSSAGIRHGE